MPHNRGGPPARGLLGHVSVRPRAQQEGPSDRRLPSPPADLRPDALLAWLRPPAVSRGSRAGARAQPGQRSGKGGAANPPGHPTLGGQRGPPWHSTPLSAGPRPPRRARLIPEARPRLQPVSVHASSQQLTSLESGKLLKLSPHGTFYRGPGLANWAPKASRLSQPGSPGCARPPLGTRSVPTSMQLR